MSFWALRADLLNRAWPSQPFWQKLADWLNWPCLVKSALKRTPVEDFNSFSIVLYYINSTTYQKIGDLFFPFIFLDFRTMWLTYIYLRYLFTIIYLYNYLSIIINFCNISSSIVWDIKHKFAWDEFYKSKPYLSFCAEFQRKKPILALF